MLRFKNLKNSIEHIFKIYRININLIEIFLKKISYLIMKS